MNPRRLALLSALLVLAADRLSKMWVLSGIHLQDVGTIPVLPFFSLSFVMNTGVSMGFLKMDTDTGRWILIAATALIAALVSFWAWKAENRAQGIALGAIAGGALGNIVDRIIYGAVVDFLHVHWMSWNFWVFNVADAGITLGVCWLLFESLRDGSKHPKTIPE